MLYLDCCVKHNLHSRYVGVRWCTDIKALHRWCVLPAPQESWPPSSFCSALERVEDKLQHRGKHSSVNSRLESKWREMLMPWLIRKRFHLWKKWECMSSKSFCLGLGRGIQLWFWKDFPRGWEGSYRKVEGRWLQPCCWYWFHNEEEMPVRSEGNALFGGRDVNEISLGFLSFFPHTQCLSASFKLGLTSPSGSHQAIIHCERVAAKISFQLTQLRRYHMVISLGSGNWSAIFEMLLYLDEVQYT